MSGLVEANVQLLSTDELWELRNLQMRELRRAMGDLEAIEREQAADSQSGVVGGRYEVLLKKYERILALLSHYDLAISVSERRRSDDAQAKYLAAQGRINASIMVATWVMGAAAVIQVLVSRAAR